MPSRHYPAAYAILRVYLQYSRISRYNLPFFFTHAAATPSSISDIAPNLKSVCLGRDVCTVNRHLTFLHTTFDRPRSQTVKLGCVRIQTLYPSKATFEDQMYHSGATILSNFDGSLKCSLEMCYTFTEITRFIVPTIEGNRVQRLNRPRPSTAAALELKNSD